MAADKIFIAIAGNIGAGKTSLTRMLSEKFGWEAHFEAVTNNPYLEDFYRDMARWSFNLQVFFLNNRFTAHQNITLGNNSAVQDRSIYEDANIFARSLYEQGKMEERDFKNYLDLYGVMQQFLAPPDLIVYLRKSLRVLKAQISKRGRSYEADIPEEYLANLGHYYDDWLERYDFGPKLILNTDDLNFVERKEDFELIANKIVEALDQKDLFLLPRSEKTG